MIPVLLINLNYVGGKNLAYQLTEPEIKAIDERYWAFAVPLEEVTEG